MKGRLILSAALGAVLLTVLVSTSLVAAWAGDELYVKGAVTRSGKPIRSAWVIVTQNGEEKGRSLTGDDGRYYIGDLYAGEYDVVVTQGPRRLFEGRVSLPEQRVYDLDLPRR